MAGSVMGLVTAYPPQGVDGRGGPPRILLGALVTAVTLGIAIWLMPDTTRIYQQALALQKGVAAFSAEEDRLSEEFQNVVNRTRAGKMNDAAALAELRGRILPAWNEAVARLGAVELDANSALRVDYELLMRYASARRDTIKAVADYLDEDTAERARDRRKAY